MIHDVIGSDLIPSVSDPIRSDLIQCLIVIGSDPIRSDLTSSKSGPIWSDLMSLISGLIFSDLISLISDLFPARLLWPRWLDHGRSSRGGLKPGQAPTQLFLALGKVTAQAEVASNIFFRMRPCLGPSNHSGSSQVRLSWVKLKPR